MLNRIKATKDRIKRSAKYVTLQPEMHRAMPDATHKEICAKLGISKGSIRCYNSGQRTPTWEILERIEKLIEEVS